MAIEIRHSHSYLRASRWSPNQIPCMILCRRRGDSCIWSSLANLEGRRLKARLISSIFTVGVSARVVIANSCMRLCSSCIRLSDVCMAEHTRGPSAIDSESKVTAIIMSDYDNMIFRPDNCIKVSRSALLSCLEFLEVRSNSTFSIQSSLHLMHRMFRNSLTSSKRSRLYAIQDTPSYSRLMLRESSC